MLPVVDVEPATVPAAASSVSSITLAKPSASSKWTSAASRYLLGSTAIYSIHKDSTSLASSNLPPATEAGKFIGYRVSVKR